MKSSKLASNLSLYVISAENTGKSLTHEDLIKAALQGGASAVQLRIKDKSSRDFYDIAMEVKKICERAQALFFINDRVDIALAVGADGVHLGQEDLPYGAARKLMGPDALIGISATCYEEAIEADRIGADYIGFGPVFVTGSKPDAAKPTGLDELARAVKAVAIPVIAIGGIDAKTVTETMATGASGIAVISAIASAHDPECETRRLATIIRASKTKE